MANVATAGGKILEQIAELDLSGDLSLDGVITPTALSGDVNNYNPAGLDGANVLRLGGGASDRNITGLTAPSTARGKLLLLVNIGTTNSLVLKNASGSSAAGNTFQGASAADVTVHKGGSVWLWYDPTGLVWCPITN